MIAPSLLLLSNSRKPNGVLFEHALSEIQAAVAGVTRAAFVPYAGVTISLDDYTARVADVFRQFGVALSSVHAAADPTRLLHDAEAIVVGGGNTFRLLTRMYDTGALGVVRQRIHAGVPYIGWSAGTVVACPTLRTTNDMPIVQPPSFEALGVVPFQINAHYTDEHPANFQGETRAQRIAEFLVVSPDVPVLGLREGSMVRVIGREATLLGAPGARLFRAGAEPEELMAGTSLSMLWSRPAATSGA